jgi:hypothetical protein
MYAAFPCISAKGTYYVEFVSRYFDSECSFTSLVISNVFWAYDLAELFSVFSPFTDIN